jgi:hypothetical protein
MALLLTGGQGIGKDLIVMPLLRLLHPEVSIIDSSDLGDKYTHWLRAKFIVGQELRQTTRGSQTGHDAYNLLKQITANTHPWLTSRGKYERPVLTANVCALWLTSNDPAPLPIELDDRRFVVFDSPARPWPGQRYQDLADWLMAGAPGHRGYDRVGEFLYRRWASMDAPRRQAVLSKPPGTASKQNLARGSRSSAASWLEDAIATEPPDPDALPDVVSAADMVDAMTKAVRNNRGLSPNTWVPSVEQMATYMRKAGCQRLHGGEPVRHKGRLRRLWSLRNHDVYTSMPPSQLSVVLDQQDVGV